MSAVQWYFGTKAIYESLEAKNKLNPEGMFFLSDTREFFYKGVQYMNNVIFFTGDLPESGITTKHLYFNTNTLVAYAHDGSQWNVIIEPASVSVLKANGTAEPIMVTGAAAKQYVDTMIANTNDQVIIDLTWDTQTGANDNSPKVDTSSFEAGVTDVSNYYTKNVSYVPATGSFDPNVTYYTDNTGATAVDPATLYALADVTSYFVKQTSVVAATGTYDPTVTYYSDSTGELTADTSELEEGVSDVSNLFVKEDSFVAATGSYDPSVTYYTDNTGATEATRETICSTVSVASYFVENATFVKATGTFVAGTVYYAPITTGTTLNFKRYGAPTVNDPNGLVINQFATSIVRNKNTGDIQILASDGVTVLATINIPLDNYIVSGRYDENLKAIVFRMSNGEDTYVYAADIIGLYNQLDSSTVDVTLTTVDGINFIKMDVKKSQVTGNELEIIEDQTGEHPELNGLYANRAHLMDFLVPITDADTIAKLDAEGNAVTSGKKIGGATASQVAAQQAVNIITEEGLTNKKTEIENYLDATYLAKETVRSQYADFAAAYSVATVQ